jgi:2-amino-4-hydroxy-6-hydroxymethyldihydropteridine diphosphokinase
MTQQNIVYIALGANLNNPIAQLQKAIKALAELRDCKLALVSSFYQSNPMGPQDQGDYINAVVKLKTNLSPIELLDNCQAIELGQGRVRKAERWGPRTLDLDLLLYNNDMINSERLVIPHYGMKTRNFVLLPLFEIAPKLTLPDGTEISELIRETEKQGIQKL